MKKRASWVGLPFLANLPTEGMISIQKHNSKQFKKCRIIQIRTDQRPHLYIPTANV